MKRAVRKARSALQGVGGKVLAAALGAVALNEIAGLIRRYAPEQYAKLGDLAPLAAGAGGYFLLKKFGRKAKLAKYAVPTLAAGAVLTAARIKEQKADALLASRLPGRSLPAPAPAGGIVIANESLSGLAGLRDRTRFDLTVNPLAS